MTKKQYILIGSIALVLTLAGTSAMILTLKNAFVLASQEERNGYNSVPVSRALSQYFGYDGKNLDRCQKNQQIFLKADNLARAADLDIVERKNYEQAYRKLNESYELLKQFPGSDCIEAVDVLTTKAECEEKLGLIEEREKTLRLLVDSAAETYNDTHEKVASALESLGDLLRNSDRATEAVPFLERAYKIRQKGEPDNSGVTAYSASLLGHCKLDLKDYAAADELYKQAIKLYEKADGTGFSESQQIARENLANSYRWQNRHKEALESEIAVLEDLKKRHLENSLFMASAYVSAADTAQDAKDRTATEKYLEQASAVLQNLDSKSDGREKAAVYSNLADVYHDEAMSQYEMSARKLCIQNYQDQKFLEDDDVIDLAENLLKGGACALKLGDHDLAIDLYDQALAQTRENQQVRLKLKDDKNAWNEYLSYIKTAKKEIQEGQTKSTAAEINTLLANEKISKTED